MKPTLFLLGVALLGFTAACQSDNQPATGSSALTSRPTAEGKVFTLPTDALFRPGDAEVTDAAARLMPLADSLHKQEAKQLIIRCYTDDQGDDGHNLALTQKRVQAVVDWLQAHGVTAAVEQQGMGEANPVAPNIKADGTPDPAGQAQNRRLEVVLMN